MKKYPKIIVTKPAKNSDDIINISTASLVSKELVSNLKYSESSPVQVREEGNLEGQSYYLSDRYNWIIGYDSQEQLVLIPTKK